MESMRENSWGLIRAEAAAASEFCEKYGALGNGHMVEFFSAEHFQKILSKSAADQLQVYFLL